MNAKLFRSLCVAVVLLSGRMCFGAAGRWADDVVSFDQPAGSSTAGGLPSAALGAPDGAFVSIDTPETLILAFTDNRVYDGPGDDLWIYEAADCGATVRVHARKSDGPCTFLGIITNSAGFDLADYPGLDHVDYVRLVGLDDSGAHAGYDLDAVEALNSIDRNVSSPAPAPAAVFLTGLGTLILATLRHRRML